MRGLHLHDLHLVNCRIGSLEMTAMLGSGWAVVNCRIGSLEMLDITTDNRVTVNCRIGSLETHHPPIQHSA